MEGISHVLCKNFRRISPHPLIIYSSTICSLLPTILGLRPFHSFLYYIYKAMVFPADNSLPLEFQGPLHYVCVVIGRNKSRIRVSCYPNRQNVMPIGIVYNNLAYFPICRLQIKFIKCGTTTRWVLCSRLRLASNVKYNTVPIAAGEVSQIKLSPLLSSSNQSEVCIEVKVSPHQDLIQGSSLLDLSIDPFPQRCKLHWVETPHCTSQIVASIQAINACLYHMCPQYMNDV